MVSPPMMGIRDAYTGKEYTWPFTRYEPMEENTGSKAARRTHTQRRGRIRELIQTQPCAG